MATHRRGLRPSQWPVRDLLGPADRGRLWDARIGAAVAGLLACSAAVTVVLTSGDTATSDASPETPQPGPLALPPPAAVDPAPVVPPALKLPPPPAALPAPAVLPAPAMPPAPAGVVPAPAAPPRLAPSRPQRSVDRPASRPRRPPAVAPAPVPGPTLAEQIAAGIEQWEDRSPDRPTAGWLLIPVQRPADAAALLELACRNCEQETGGRHRAPDRDDVEQSPDRYREGGRHRAPDPEDDRSERYRSGTTRSTRTTWTSGSTRTAIVPRSAGTTPTGTTRTGTTSTPPRTGSRTATRRPRTRRPRTRPPPTTRSGPTPPTGAPPMRTNTTRRSVSRATPTDPPTTDRGGAVRVDRPRPATSGRLERHRPQRSPRSAHRSHHARRKDRRDHDPAARPRPRGGGAPRRRGPARRRRGQGDRARRHHPAPPGFLLLRLRRDRAPARHPPRRGQAGVPTGVDRHLLRSPGAGRGPRRRGAPPAARRAGRPGPRSHARCSRTSPTAPPTAPSRRTSCAPSTPAGSRAIRRRRPTRWPSGCGGTGTSSSPPPRPRTASCRPGPGCRPRCSTPCSTPCPASSAGRARPAAPPRVAVRPASCASRTRVALRTASARTVRAAPPAPRHAAAPAAPAAAPAGTVHDPVASCRSPTSSGPDGAERVADALRHRRHPRGVGDPLGAQHEEVEPEREAGSLPGADQHRPTGTAPPSARAARRRARRRSTRCRRRRSRPGGRPGSASAGSTSDTGICTSPDSDSRNPATAGDGAEVAVHRRQPGQDRVERQRLESEEDGELPGQGVAQQRPCRCGRSPAGGVWPRNRGSQASAATAAGHRPRRRARRASPGPTPRPAARRARPRRRRPR